MCLYNIIFLSAINCTQPPFPVKNNDLGMYNWTAVDGVDPRPYASAIKYYCPRENWAYPSTGLNEVMVYCLRDGTWSNQFNIETCQSKGSSIRDIYFKPCPKRYSKPYTNMNIFQKSAQSNTNDMNIWKNVKTYTNHPRSLRNAPKSPQLMQENSPVTLRSTKLSLNHPKL